MNLIKLLEEREERNRIKDAVEQAIIHFDFKNKYRRMVVLNYICEILGQVYWSGLAAKIKRELIKQKIMPVVSLSKRYYRHQDFIRRKGLFNDFRQN